MQQSKKGGVKVHIVWAGVLTLAGFVGGVYVGLHPLWIPWSIPGGSDLGDNGQSRLPRYSPPAVHATSEPTTQSAATEPSPSSGPASP